MARVHDIYPIDDEYVNVSINGEEYKAAKGETVLSTLMSHNIQTIHTNDHKKNTGAYCGMGVCFCCLVSINGAAKQRACQTIVERDMEIKTQYNRIYNGEKDVEQCLC